MDWGAIIRYLAADSDMRVIFIGLSGFMWYKVLKMLFGQYLSPLSAAYPIISVPEWTEVDEFYHTLFVEHVNHCRYCDPQDNPCELGQQMLDDWKVAKEIE